MQFCLTSIAALFNFNRSIPDYFMLLLKLIVEWIFTGYTCVIQKCRYLPVVCFVTLSIAELFFSLYLPAAPVAEALKRVDMVYYIDFPWHKKYENKIVRGCHLFFLHSGNKVLRCEENISLLRPRHIIKSWQKQQYQMGFLPLTIKEFGIKNVRGYIKKNKSVPLNISPPYGQNTEARSVIGRFVRHVTDVRKYQFRNTVTGKLSSILATPNHPFYVKNRRRFIPLEAILSEDEMVQRNGQIIKMICSYGSHCGAQAKEGIVSVYNLEIAQRHTYFLGHDFILAHNPCTREEGTGKRKRSEMTDDEEDDLDAEERAARKKMREKMDDDAQYALFKEHNLIRKIKDPDYPGDTVTAFILPGTYKDHFIKVSGHGEYGTKAYKMNHAFRDTLKRRGFFYLGKTRNATSGKYDITWILRGKKRLDLAKMPAVDAFVPVPVPVPVSMPVPAVYDDFSSPACFEQFYTPYGYSYSDPWLPPIAPLPLFEEASGPAVPYR